MLCYDADIKIKQKKSPQGLQTLGLTEQLHQLAIQFIIESIIHID